MSKLSLSGDPSGTGTFTIAAPNSNTDRTINLPDAAGDMVLTTATQSFTNKSFDSAPVSTVSGTAPLYMCRAWVNFDGTTSPGTIRASGNVSSVTTNGSGDYTINFTTAMPDTNYSTKMTTNRSSGNTTIVNLSRIADELASPTASSIRVVHGVVDANRNLQKESCSIFCVAIFR